MRTQALVKEGRHIIWTARVDEALPEASFAPEAIARIAHRPYPTPKACRPLVPERDGSEHPEDSAMVVVRLTNTWLLGWMEATEEAVRVEVRALL